MMETYVRNVLNICCKFCNFLIKFNAFVAILEIYDWKDY